MTEDEINRHENARMHMEYVTKEAIRPSGYDGQNCTFGPWKVVMWTCGDRLCMRSREGSIPIGVMPADLEVWTQQVLSRVRKS